MTISIHDPLYGLMDMSDTEIRIIDSPAFRRLHRIRQLSQAYMVYPSASHTRFEHSLGVCHMAGQVAKKVGIDEKKIPLVRLAGLLHDIGHGPFSHLFEPAITITNRKGVTHETISHHIIRNEECLVTILGEDTLRITAILDHKPVPGWDTRESALASEIISGPLDVDRMDYLRRDSYHLGVSYGKFDAAQLVHSITTTPDAPGRLCISMKGWGAAQGYRLSRFLMHAQVYHHHTIMAANRMLMYTLESALEEGVLDSGTLNMESDKFLANYMMLDDQSLVNMILSNGTVSARMMGRLQRRDILKRVYQIYTDRDIPDAGARLQLARMTNTQCDEMAREIADTLNLEYHDIIAHSSHIPVNHNENQILVLWKNQTGSLNQHSPMISSHSPIDRFYVFGPDTAHVRQGVSKYMSERFGI